MMDFHSAYNRSVAHSMFLSFEHVIINEGNMFHSNCLSSIIATKRF